METQKPTLHVFGGGELVKDCEQIAQANGWRVVLRTGERFVSSLPELSESTNVLVGNKLMDLMKEGGLPAKDDIGISLSAPWVIPQSVIDQFAGRLFNLHHAPLPRFRGAGGQCWRILMGDRKGGVCIHHLVRGIDAGDILAKAEFDFPEELRFPQEYDDFILGYSKELFAKWLASALRDGPCAVGKKAEAQIGEGEYWPRLHTDTHGWINWSWPLDHIGSFCDAFSYPYRGALTTVRYNNIRIKKVSVQLEKDKYHPFQTGLVFRMDSDRLWVAHCDGTLLVEDYSLDEPSKPVRLGDRLFSPAEKLELALKSRIQYKPDGEVFEN